VVPYIIVAAVLLPREDHPWTDDGQTAGAFSRVESALTFFNRTLPIAGDLQSCGSNVLTTFRFAIDKARELGTKPPCVSNGLAHSGRDLLLH